MTRLVAIMMYASALAAACVEVEADQIRANDLAEFVPAFQGMDASLGYAPAPGTQRILTGVEIRRHLQRLRLPVDSSYRESVCVKRRQVSYARSEFLKAVEQMLGTKGARIELVRFGPLAGPPGEIEFSRRGYIRASPSSQTLMCKGRLRFSEHSSIPVWAEVRFSGQAEVLVARTDLAAGRMLEHGDLDIALRPLAPFARNEALTVEQAAGHVLRRSVRAGTPILPSALAVAPDVKRGESVRIEAQSGAAFLTISGTAEASGRIGEQIAVRSGLNGRLLEAVVRSKGVVSTGDVQ